jgi:hypothetical protein
MLGTLFSLHLAMASSLAVAAVKLIRALGGGSQTRQLADNDQADSNRKWTGYLILPVNFDATGCCRRLARIQSRVHCVWFE